jgi:hypothetical protein
MSDPDAPDWGTEDPVDHGALMMATPELLNLARAVRGPGWATRLGAALEAARVADWDWGRRGKFAANLVFATDGDPKALTDAAGGTPRGAKPAARPDSAARGAEMARRLLAEKAAQAAEAQPDDAVDGAA